MRSFSIVADNVNGLADPATCRAFFAWLQQQGADVVTLSETHSRSDQQTKRWVQQGAGPGLPWRGHAFWHHKPCAQRERATAGVGVLLSDRIVMTDTEPEVEYVDGQGRVLRVVWTTPWGQQLAAIVVYFFYFLFYFF